MTHWNHRVVKITGKHYPYDEDWYTVCEVFYNDDGSIFGYADATVAGGNFEDLRRNAEQILDAVDKPMLIDPVTVQPED